VIFGSKKGDLVIVCINDEDQSLAISESKLNVGFEIMSIIEVQKVGSPHEHLMIAFSPFGKYAVIDANAFKLNAFGTLDINGSAEIVSII
jgi:hypothetical protein